MLLPRAPAAAAAGVRAASNESLRAYLWRATDARLTRLTRAMLRGYRAWLDWLEQEAAGAVEGQNAAGAMVTRQGLPSEDEAARMVVDLTDDPRRDAIERGWQAVVADLGVEASFDWLDPQVLKLLADREIAIRGAAATETERLRASLAEGLAAGESRTQLVARIHEQIAEAYTGQALTIARTETQASYAGARFLGMEDLGVRRHEWLSARDARVRESHAEIDGETVPLGDTFSNGLRFPLDPQGAAAEVVNCRCTALPVIEEEAP